VRLSLAVLCSHERAPNVERGLPLGVRVTRVTADELIEQLAMRAVWGAIIEQRELTHALVTTLEALSRRGVPLPIVVVGSWRWIATVDGLAFIGLVARGRTADDLWGALVRRSAAALLQHAKTLITRRLSNHAELSAALALAIDGSSLCPTMSEAARRVRVDIALLHRRWRSAVGKEIPGLAVINDGILLVRLLAGASPSVRGGVGHDRPARIARAYLETSYSRLRGAEWVRVVEWFDRTVIRSLAMCRAPPQ
jgi:hypothetical protein